MGHFYDSNTWIYLENDRRIIIRRSYYRQYLLLFRQLIKNTNNRQ